MPKVRLNFQVNGFVSQTVHVPQEVIDRYRAQVESGEPDCEALDRMLEPFIRYEEVLDQLDDAEDIELTELKVEAAA